MSSDEVRRRLRPGDDWGLADGVMDGEPMIARVRTQAAEAGIAAGLVVRLSFEVALKEAFRGLPTMGEQNELDGLEDQLRQLADESGSARLVLLVSSGGKRHMVLYCREPGWAAGHAESLGVIFSDRTVEIFEEHDAEWDVHRRFVAAVR